MVFFVLKSVKRRVEMFYHKLKAKNQMRNVYNIVNIGTFHSCFFHFIMNLQDVVRSKKSSFLNCIAFSTEHGGAACDLICRSILCEFWWEYRLNNNNNLTQIVINIHTNITYDKRPYFFYLLSALFINTTCSCYEQLAPFIIYDARSWIGTGFSTFCNNTYVILTYSKPACMYLRYCWNNVLKVNE